jgi:hypothetical protein
VARAPQVQNGSTGAQAAVGAAHPNAAPTPAAARRGAAAGRRSYGPAIADYSYVPGDLRRIGILAGSLILALIALSFVIR